MTTLANWARDWNIPVAALIDLQRRMGACHDADQPKPLAGMSEEAVKQRGRLAFARTGARLWRNNTGAHQDESGRMIRYGLCNESKQMNQVLKSADYVGITPHVVTPADVGHTLGIFTAPEFKRGDWHYTGKDREVAQKNFIDLVVSLGGRAMFWNGSDQI